MNGNPAKTTEEDILEEKRGWAKDVLKARCSDCQNLEPGNWCKAKRCTVPGSRHLRKCDLFQQGTPKPPPVRPGKPQNPDLVQCVSCAHFAGWGRCGVELPDFSRGEYGSRIWRWCSSHCPAEPTGACSDCRRLVGKVCCLTGFVVTTPDRPISCQYFVK